MSLMIFEGNLNDETHKSNLIKLLNEYIEDKMGGGIPFGEEKSHMLIEDIKNIPTIMIVFAVIDGDYCGLAVCFYGYSTFNAKKLINIHDIIVSKRHRNKGIGRSMLEFIINKGKKSGCCKITLEVRVDNDNAKHLYASLGFKDSDPPMLFWNKNL